MPALVAVEDGNDSNSTLVSNNSISKEKGKQQQPQKTQRASVRPRDSAKAPLPDSFVDDLMEASMRSHTICTAGNTSYSNFDMSTTQFSSTQRISDASKGCYMDPLPDEMESPAPPAAAPVKEKPKPINPPSASKSVPPAAIPTTPQPPRPISPKPEARSARPFLPEEPRARAIARARARAQNLAEEAAAAAALSAPEGPSSKRPSALLTKQQKSSRTSLQVGDLTKSKMGMGKESSWYAMSCTSQESAMYDSYKNASSLKHLTLDERKASIVEQMHLSRVEKDALNAVHGFYFSESELEDEEDDDESDIENQDDMPVERTSM